MTSLRQVPSHGPAIVLGLKEVCPDLRHSPSKLEHPPATTEMANTQIQVVNDPIRPSFMVGEFSAGPITRASQSRGLHCGRSAMPLDV